MYICRIGVLIALAGAAAAAQEQPCAGLPPGRHALLERLTAQLSLTCAQQLRIEPLLHSEESVTKPLLKFTSLTPEEQQSIMTTIKLAARRQVRSVLTPEQQKGMDEEVDSVRKTAGSKKKSAKQAPSVVPGLEGEETLSQAIGAYTALTPEEKSTMLLTVKAAARRDAALQLTPEQQAKLDREIAELKK